MKRRKICWQVTHQIMQRDIFDGNMSKQFSGIIVTGECTKLGIERKFNIVPSQGIVNVVHLTADGKGANLTNKAKPAALC